MRHSCWTALVLTTLIGCQAIEDREAIRPIAPEEATKVSYPDLLYRARKQGDVAVARAYDEVWVDVEDAARSLEQTARLLPKAPQAPDKKDEIKPLIDSIGQDAKKLSEAARTMPTLTGAPKEARQREVDGLLRNLTRNIRTLRALQMPN